MLAMYKTLEEFFLRKTKIEKVRPSNKNCSFRITKPFNNTAVRLWVGRRVEMA